MAQRAESLNPEPTIPARLVPVSEAAIPEAAPDRMDEPLESAGEAYRNVKENAGRIASNALGTAGSFANDIGRRFRRIKHENPLLIVAVAAGAGLLFGVLLRGWRSRIYE